jgi:hypothetical protein
MTEHEKKSDRAEHNQFLTEMSQLTGMLFRDSLAEGTRKRLDHLLIASIITILISITTITVSEASVSGLSLILPDKSVLKLIGGSITIYFLITYLMKVAQDSIDIIKVGAILERAFS